MFLDEPTTGLDPLGRAKVWDEVRRLNREFGMTIFLTTQYLEEADKLARRVAIIDGGRLVAEGTPEQLKRSVGDDLVVVDADGDPAIAAATVARLDVVVSASVHHGQVVARVSDGAAAISPIAVSLADAEISVTSLTLRTPTLDDVFLELTGNRIGAVAQ